MIQTSPDSEKSVVLTSTFFELVMDYSNRYPSPFASRRQVRAPSGPDFPWVMVSYEALPVPQQGWKLHLAACDASAEQLLHLVLPLLLSEEVSFKVLGSLQDLARLNSGSAGLSQIGKFLTIYPHDEEQAVRLATSLDAATRGLPAPSVPSDRPLHPGSLVFYRYGSFQPQIMQTVWGAFQAMIQTPEQELIADPRHSSYLPPDWVVDPFLTAGVAEELPAPQMLLADRYLLLTTLYQTAQSRVFLAVDLQEARRCVIKCPGLGFVQGRGQGEDSICKRLRYEAQVLAALAPHPGFPVCYDLVEEQGKVFLVLEDLDGETLAQHIQRYVTQGYKTPRRQVIAWGKELTAMLEAIHAKGLLYRDLKASNVIITADGQLHLIDFGLVYGLNSDISIYGLGTPGYMSPRQQKGEPPTVSDDLYSLGALLYLIGTGAEPSLAPREAALTTRPPRLLNPTLDQDLAEIIERCLKPNPGERFVSAAELRSALEALSPTTNDPVLVSSAASSEQIATRRTPEDYRQLARRLSETLSHAAQPDPQGTGLRWTSTHYIGKGRQARDLNTGNSGSLLAFAELVAEFSDPSQRQVLAEAARWLTTAPRLPGPILAGLYVGEAGVGTALLRAGQVLSDTALMNEALERGRFIATLPFGSPDLFNGTAGRIRFHLWLWDATADPLQLQAAVRAGEELLNTAERNTAAELFWRIPSGYGNMGGSVLLGYAHGAAGIGDVLLDLYEASQQERFLTAAQAAGCWLERQAVAVLGDASGLHWPDVDVEGAHPRGAFWCHGATGIGSFFLHAAQLQVFPASLEIAQRAARTVAHGNRACGPVQCHGLAGNIEFLLDMAQFTDNQEYRSQAFELAALLEAFAVEKDGMLVWSSESPIIFTPDYMVGYAGIALTLLRLADSQRPRQLTRSGLTYMGSAQRNQKTEMHLQMERTT
ncbi:MAG TPA: class IV lanthionine synthetase LanL [Ktedonobacteraceae bacterium]|nr:class IV lanthionine synthetase LanL [Ktedonobacteraceae bacterium]